MKRILKCPKCKKKIKISDKFTKYRCPYCQNIYNYTRIKKFKSEIFKIFIAFIETLSDIKYSIKNKITNLTKKY